MVVKLLGLIQEDYDADYEASRIQTFIIQFKGRQSKKLNKRLKEQEDEIKKKQVKSLNKIKVFKIGCQKSTARLQRMKNAELKIKVIKTGTEIGATYCLGCQNYTHNFKPQEVKLTDKVLQEKSDCVFCQSSKSRFLKQKHINKK